MAEPIGLKKHTLLDHLMGEGGLHSHAEGEYDHDHDHDDIGDYDVENDSLWLQDHIQLVSVGLDIGSSGTQVIFSRVYMRRLSEELTSRYFVVKRETLFQSPVALTPTGDRRTTKGSSLRRRSQCLAMARRFAASSIVRSRSARGTSRPPIRRVQRAARMRSRTPSISVIRSGGIAWVSVGAAMSATMSAARLSMSGLSRGIKQLNDRLPAAMAIHANEPSGLQGF